MLEYVVTWRDVEGWFSPSEGKRLQALAQLVPMQYEIVELGAYAGRSTVCMAEVARAHITSIDPWDIGADPADPSQEGSDRIFASYVQTLTTRGMWDNVTALRAFSWDIATKWVKPVGLLFLDATHVYEHTVRDLDEWGKFIPKGGFAALHDDGPDHPGVTRAVKEAIESGLWHDHGKTRSLRVLERT